MPIEARALRDVEVGDLDVSASLRILAGDQPSTGGLSNSALGRNHADSDGHCICPGCDCLDSCIASGGRKAMAISLCNEMTISLQPGVVNTQTDSRRSSGSQSRPFGFAPSRAGDAIAIFGQTHSTVSSHLALTFDKSMDHGWTA